MRRVGDKTTKGKKIKVVFKTKELEKQFEDLKDSNIYLYRQIKKAMNVLGWSPWRGDYIPPEKYYKIKKYERFWEYRDIGLYKYPLGKKDAFRLIYTYGETKALIADIIIEWGPHDMYKDLLIVAPTKFFYFRNKNMKLYKDL